MQTLMRTLIESLPRRWKYTIFLAIDLLLILLGLALAAGLLKGVAPTPGVVLYLLAAIAGAALEAALGLPAMRLIDHDSRALAKVGLMALVLALGGAGLAHLAPLFGLPANLPGALFIMFGFLYFGLAVIARLIGLKALQAVYRSGTPRTPVLIYGAGATGVQLAAALARSPHLQTVGFVDDNKTLQGLSVAGLKVHAPGALADLVRSRHVRRVLLAIPSLSQTRRAQISTRLGRLGIDVQHLPAFTGLETTSDLTRLLEPLPASTFLGRQPMDRDLPEISSVYTGKLILVTGAGGSIGAELCRQLLACGPAGLVLLDHSEPALYEIDRELQTLTQDRHVPIIPVLGSVTEAALLTRLLAAHKVQIVLHAAAYKHVPLVEANGLEGLRNNVLGTRTLARAAVAAGVERFVLISSDKAVRPTGLMGASKRMAELLVQDMARFDGATLFSMVRFGNVLGSSGSVVPLFQDQIARGGPLTLTHENMTRYFMTLPEAARLVLLAGGFATGGDVFVLDMGKPVPILRLARQMIRAAGYHDGDIEITTIGPRPGEKLFEELLIGARMQATPHPKILRAQEAALSEIEVATMIRDLEALVATGDAVAVPAFVRRWVDGFAPGGAMPRSSARIQGAPER